MEIVILKTREKRGKYVTSKRFMQRFRYFKTNVYIYQKTGKELSYEQVLKLKKEQKKLGNTVVIKTL